MTRLALLALFLVGCVDEGRTTEFTTDDGQTCSCTCTVPEPPGDPTPTVETE